MWLIRAQNNDFLFYTDWNYANKLQIHLAIAGAEFFSSVGEARESCFTISLTSIGPRLYYTTASTRQTHDYDPQSLLIIPKVLRTISGIWGLRVQVIVTYKCFLIYLSHSHTNTYITTYFNINDMTVSKTTQYIIPAEIVKRKDFCLHTLLLDRNGRLERSPTPHTLHLYSWVEHGHRSGIGEHKILQHDELH